MVNSRLALAALAVNLTVRASFGACACNANTLAVQCKTSREELPTPTDSFCLLFVSIQPIWPAVGVVITNYVLRFSLSLVNSGQTFYESFDQ